MTLDSSLTFSAAADGTCLSKRLPNGIRVTETDDKSASEIEGVPCSEEVDDLPWSYLMMHNKQVELFKKQVEDYNRLNPENAHECFVHFSFRYKQKSNGQGVEKKQLQTVSGLVFLQGETKSLQEFLRINHPQCHLVNDCCTGKPAVIPNRVMRPFMDVMKAHPENITFLRDPFVKFAKEHVRLRVLTGIFEGLEGYVVRVDRDRQLIMELGGYAVAIRGVHTEDFEVVGG